MNRYQGIQKQAEHWRQRKAHRLQEFTSLQVQLLCLRRVAISDTPTCLAATCASLCAAGRDRQPQDKIWSTHVPAETLGDKGK